MANQPNPHIFGLWEETGAPGGNPRSHGANMQFSMANPPNLHIFGLWEETGASGGNLCRHDENVKTPYSHPRPELNLGPWRCEAAVLTTVPPCHPYGTL